MSKAESKTAASPRSSAPAPARTVYPAGWPAELLEAMDPTLAGAVEAIVELYAGGGWRLRALEAPQRDEVRVGFLLPNGELFRLTPLSLLLRGPAMDRGLTAREHEHGGCVLSLARPLPTAPEAADAEV